MAASHQAAPGVHTEPHPSHEATANVDTTPTVSQKPPTRTYNILFMYSWPEQMYTSTKCTGTCIFEFSVVFLMYMYMKTQKVYLPLPIPNLIPLTAQASLLQGLHVDV